MAGLQLLLLLLGLILWEGLITTTVLIEMFPLVALSLEGQFLQPLLLKEVSLRFPRLRPVVEQEYGAGVLDHVPGNQINGFNMGANGAKNLERDKRSLP